MGVQDRYRMQLRMKYVELLTIRRQRQIPAGLPQSSASNRDPQSRVHRPDGVANYVIKYRFGCTWVCDAKRWRLVRFTGSQGCSRCGAPLGGWVAGSGTRRASIVSLSPIGSAPRQLTIHRRICSRPFVSRARPDGSPKRERTVRERLRARRYTA